MNSGQPQDAVSFSKAAMCAAKATGVACLGAFAGWVAIVLSSLAHSDAVRNSSFDGFVPVIFVIAAMFFGVGILLGLGGVTVAFGSLYEYIYDHWRKLSRFAAVPTLAALLLPLLVISIACFLLLGSVAVFAVGAAVVLWPIVLIVILAAILCKR
jgi:hypothetical protein